MSPEDIKLAQLISERLSKAYNNGWSEGRLALLVQIKSRLSKELLEEFTIITKGIS